MAKKVVTTTEFIDDLDGGAAAGTVSFSFDGTNYEIDLSKRNKSAMEKAFKPYIDKARKARATRRTQPRSATRRHNLPAIRAWAKESGFEVSDRGRVSQEVIDAYAAAH